MLLLVLSPLIFYLLCRIISLCIAFLQTHNFCFTFSQPFISPSPTLSWLDPFCLNISEKMIKYLCLRMVLWLQPYRLTTGFLELINIFIKEVGYKLHKSGGFEHTSDNRNQRHAPSHKNKNKITPPAHNNQNKIWHLK